MQHNQRMNFFTAVVTTLLAGLIVGVVALGVISFVRNTQVTVGQPLALATDPAPPARVEPLAATAPATPSAPLGDVAAAMFTDVNAARCEAGLTPLTPNTLLDAVARQHADDMAANAFFAHEGSDGGTVVERANAVGYVWQRLGENIAAGMPTPQEAFAAWMQSPGHRANILEPEFREMGFAVLNAPGSEYDIYWVQVFGTAPEPADPPPCP